MTCEIIWQVAQVRHFALWWVYYSCPSLCPCRKKPWGTGPVRWWTEKRRTSQNCRLASWNILPCQFTSAYKTKLTHHFVFGARIVHGPHISLPMKHLNWNRDEQKQQYLTSVSSLTCLRSPLSRQAALWTVSWGHWAVRESRSKSGAVDQSVPQVHHPWVAEQQQPGLPWPGIWAAAVPGSFREWWPMPQWLPWRCGGREGSVTAAGSWWFLDVFCGLIRGWGYPSAT